MANEASLSVSMTYAKSNVDSITRSKSMTVTVSGVVLIHNVQAVGTSEEALLLGDVAAGGWCYIENLDATNYVTVKSATSVAPLIRMKPTEAALFRLDAGATAPYVQANTSSCNVEYMLLSD